MIEKPECWPTIKLASCLASLVAIIILFTVPGNGVLGKATVTSHTSLQNMHQISQGELGELGELAIAKIRAAKAAFSSKIKTFSPELYDLSAFGDLEATID